MEQKRMGFAKRLKTLLSVFAVAIAAAVSLAAVPQGAMAAEYNNEPIPGVDNQPGFRWVNATDDMPAHYLIYDPVDDPSHEACVGWWYFAYYSHVNSFDGYLIRLDSDLDFEKYQFERDGGDPNQLSVGSEDLPFSGVFDGCGHTISNLTNERSGLDLQMDNGFFGWTNGATIKNIGFKDCYIGGSYRDGLVAGYAQDTFFLNITAENCTTSVIPANNVLNLITNAGISGGTIAGVANGCTLYNCEMRGGRVVTNATAGIAALGGQPLYMGGLVGFANDTVIEYSRVTDIMAEDGTRDYAEVSGTYETAVSVANYSEVFVGGIVGGIQREDTGTKIVDCYSTADVYGKAAIYFGVGLGLGVTRAYCGGIVGIAWADGKGENLIERTSYAGNLHSYQYNQLLLGIPIIQEDAYMGGILSVGADNVKVNQAYFDRSASSTDKEIKAYQYWTTDTDGPTDGGNFGPRDNDYANRDFWESCDFDFAGGTLRDYDYPYTADVTESEWKEDHYNKWAMDYKRGIPVHSGSIKATMDFPGSGTVTIGETSLSDNPEGAASKGWMTSNPYDFAVQGYTEAAEEDGSIELTYTFTTEENDSWAADSQNQGFRFMGWYGTRDVQVNDIAENHSLFTTPNNILNTEGEGLLSTDEDAKYLVQANTNDGDPDQLTVKYPDSPDDPKTGEYADNDLYVAYAQAQVLLHDVVGNLLNGDGAPEKDGETWYDYAATLELPSTMESDGVGTFIGWTTVASNDTAENDTGYASIDSAKLASLKEQGAFWEPGATFTVTEPVNLYPVFSEYNNVSVIYEGHDAEGDLTKRTRYGQAVKSTDESTGDLILSVQPANDSPILAGTVRFLGWYEYVGDASTASEADEDVDAGSWVRVSRGTQSGGVAVNTDCYTFNVSESGADLTQNLIYKARFEYCVDYEAYHIGEEHYTQYAELWEPYNAAFEVIGGPSYYEYYFNHWAQNDNFTPENEKSPIECTSCDTQMSNTNLITEPITVVAHYEKDDNGEHHVVVTTDFPSGPQVHAKWSGIPGFYHLHAKIDDGRLVNGNSSDGITGPTSRDFWFHGWTFDSIKSNSSSDRYETSLSTDYDAGHTSDLNSEGWIEAHVTAEVNFHGLPNNSTNTVQRTFKENIFLADAKSRRYDYHYNANKGYEHTSGATVKSTSAASPTDASMARDGYAFLGWIEKTDPSVTEDELAHVVKKMDGADFYVATSPQAVAPYLMTGDETCTRPMDLYPVYVEFDLATTTNIAEAGVDTETYNVPDNPTLSDENIESALDTVQVTYNDGKTFNLSYDVDGNAKVSVQVDTDTNVWITPPDGIENEQYTFISLSVLEDGVEVATIPADKMTDGTTTYDITAGHSYVFRANYSPVPVTVTYHLGESGEGSIEQFACEVGDYLPTTNKVPSFTDYIDSFFVGWTVGNADGEPVAWTDEVKLVSPGRDTVTGTMHLWPVYRSGNVNVQSNIDSSMDNTNFRRAVKHANDESGLWLEADEVEGYEFKGWSKDYSESGDYDTTFATQNQYRLTGDARFDGATYTAIYEKVNQIRYHDTEGNVIYTASVKAEDNRTFVTEQRVTITNPDGTTQEVTQSVPIDIQAFSAIATAIAQKNAVEDATAYEQFVMWQWVDTESKAPERWSNDENSFVNESVNNNMGDDGVMNLYPVTVTLEATDSKNSAYTAIQAQLELDDETNKLSKATVTLLESYDQPWLKVHIDEVAYAPEDQSVVGTDSEQTDVPVELYTPGSEIGSPVASDTTRSEKDTVDGVELDAGDALFKFSGRITITKSSTDASAAGRVFSFTVKDESTIEARTVTLQMPDKPTNGAYTAKVTISVPFGKYTVTEDTGWAWRYNATVEHWELDTDTSSTGNQSGWTNGGSVHVKFDSVPTVNNPDGVTSAVMVTNSLVKDSWLDGDAIAHNVFGTPAGDSTGNAENGGE